VAHLPELAHQVSLPGEVLVVVDVTDLDLELEFHQLGLDAAVIGELLAHHALHLGQENSARKRGPVTGQKSRCLRMPTRAPLSRPPVRAAA
jgi:hypothetical protein